MAFISYTERPISALGSAWEAGTRLIWSKPFIIGPEYSPIQWTAFWNRAHQKHAHPNTQTKLNKKKHAFKKNRQLSIRTRQKGLQSNSGPMCLGDIGNQIKWAYVWLITEQFKFVAKVL